MLFTIVFTILALFVLIWKRVSSYRLLLNCGFSVAKPVHLIRGNLDFFLSPSAFTNYGQLSKRYGSTYGIMHGGTPVVVTNDVNLIHAVSQTHFDHFHAKLNNPLDPDPVQSSSVHMFNARGERWKRMRAITSQAISAQNMQALYPIIQESVNSFLNHLNGLVTSTPTLLEPHRIFQNHTSDVLARCAFGQTQSMHNDNIYHTIFSRSFGNVLRAEPYSLEVLAWCFPSLGGVLRGIGNVANYLGIVFQNLKSPLLQFNELLTEYRIRRVAGATRYDFLQYFKNAEDANFDGYLREKSDGIVNMANVRIQKKMTTEEIVAQCRFLSIAGFDTTANTMTLLCDLLAKNQLVQVKLLEEIDSMQEVTYNSVSNLTFLHNCLFETLRLYPHASPLQTRKCMSDIKINNILIRSGVGLVIDPWTVHHDPKIWGTDVNEFRPERFESLTNEQRRSFIPFGVGPRQCVGMRFALLEMKVTICHFLRHFTIAPKPPSKLKMTLRDTLTIWPDSVWITLQRRSTNRS